MRIKQGDAYSVYIGIKDDDGSPISVDKGEAELIEVTLGRLRRLYPGDMTEWPAYKWSGVADIKLSPVTEFKPSLFGDGVLSHVVVGDIVEVTLLDKDEATWDGEKYVGEVIYTDKRIIVDVWAHDPEESYPSLPENSDAIILDNYIVPYPSPAGEYKANIKSVHFGEYEFPLTQEETFAMSGVLPLEARVKFADQQVVGISLGVVNVEETQSKEVL